MTSGNDLAGTGTNESDLRVSQAATESYMTPANYSGYDEASEYHSLPQDHQPPHPFNLDGSPEFYSTSGIHLEPKYQQSPFKNYPRGNLTGISRSFTSDIKKLTIDGAQQVDTTRGTARAVDTANTTRRHSKRFQEAEAEVEVVALGVISGEWALSSTCPIIRHS